ncbi:hypothetical protein Tco_0823406 [Tanacetum coccineum]|uniref:Uncharacterized protein n=1 Tax=Tanacetum coccineum TaxID=301880 RepID=A0ABQ5AKE6_9ASTR
MVLRIEDCSSYINVSESAQDRDVGLGGKLIQKLRQKGVYEESFSRHAAWIGGKLIQFMHTTMVPVKVKTMKIQAGIQDRNIGSCFIFFATSEGSTCGSVWKSAFRTDVCGTLGGPTPWGGDAGKGRVVFLKTLSRTKYRFHKVLENQLLSASLLICLGKHDCVERIPSARRDGVAGIKRRHRDLYGDGVRNLAPTSGHGRLKEDLESSTWRPRQDFKATPSQ